MQKIPKKKTIKYFLFIIIPVYILIIVANYFLGTQKIIDAQQNKFRGGGCGESQLSEPICNSKSGFDIYCLYMSLLLFTFIVGLINVILDKSLSFSLLIVFASGLSYLIITEALIKILNIPVLYTNFLEARQSLYYGAFSAVDIAFNIPPLFLAIISSLIGNITGFPFIIIRKKLSKK